MKAVVPTETADAPTLVELLANKGEYASVKAQAFLELKRLSRQLRGVMLLCDDLAGLASIDEAAGKVRLEHAGTAGPARRSRNRDRRLAGRGQESGRSERRVIRTGRRAQRARWRARSRAASVGAHSGKLSRDRGRDRCIPAAPGGATGRGEPTQADRSCAPRPR